MIIIVFGLPGSGKSYFASRLAKALSAGYINSDLERKKMFAERTYTAAEKLSVYEEMLSRVKEAVKDAKDLVVDATFYKQDIRQKFIEAAKPGTVIFIGIKAGEELTRQRLSKQRKDSDADFSVYKLIRSQWEPMLQEHLVLESTGNNIDEMISTAVAYCKQKQP
jgi:predicted kinase